MVRRARREDVHVLLEEVLGEELDLSREGGTEHESLPLVDARHVASLDDLPDLGCVRERKTKRIRIRLL
jgi:hypothetical protein